MATYIPSLAALQSEDDGQLAAELRLARLRTQAAVLRSLADCIERLTHPGDADGLSAQTIEEMKRLGALLLRSDRYALGSLQIEDESGVFAAGSHVRVDGRTGGSQGAANPRTEHRSDSS
jgi:hypothetical protein